MRILCLLLLVLPAAVLSAGEGVPFFRNYTAAEYGGHNRNFDVVTGKEGITYFANFEGLLSFDNSTWRMIYAPGYARITRLLIDSKGTLWAGGYNIVTKAVTDKSGPVVLKPVVAATDSLKIGEVEELFEVEGKIYFCAGEKRCYQILEDTIRKVSGLTPVTKPGKPNKVTHSLRLHNGWQVLAIQSEGLLVLDREGNKQYALTEANGLCSNNIIRLAESESGCIWGVTDNGIFRVYAPSMFTHYTPAENLRGEVTSIRRHNNHLYIGTLHGLYLANGGRVDRILSVNQACWQLLLTPGNRLYAAGSEGIFEVNGRKAHRLSENHTLSLAADSAGDLYAGEIDGIGKFTFAGGRREYVKVAAMDKVTRLTWDDTGGLVAQSLLGDVYYKSRNGREFVRSGSLPTDNSVSCRVGSRMWRTDAEGKNISISGKGSDKGIEWQNTCLAALKEKTIRIIYPESDSLVWLGGDWGVIKVDFSVRDAAFNHPLRVYIREVNEDEKNISFRFSSDAVPIHREMDYQYMLEGYDDDWCAWTDVGEKTYTHLFYGSYTFKLRARDSFDRCSAGKEYSFTIPWPFYLKWYSILLYILLFAALVYTCIRWRLRKLVKEKEYLESIIDSRTRQVVEQKNEIEEKSQNLERALGELRHAQADLVRQEKMATVGKLTKGLIDRILNPLNYINNFSHLSSELVKDLRANLVSAKENIDRSAYEDSMDILNMMGSNLQKIEMHGGNTSRILKAMEEVLKDRNKQKHRMDLVALCRKSIELLGMYYKEDIERMHISVHAYFPEETLMIQGNEEQLEKTLMSLLNNSMYALFKKYGKRAYSPEINISMHREELFVSVCIKDNGIGIEEAILQQIFDPFFTTKTTAEAAGVGLYLSKEILANHGGTIQVNSCKDEYTEFIIRLPIE